MGISKTGYVPRAFGADEVTQRMLTDDPIKDFEADLHRVTIRVDETPKTMTPKEFHKQVKEGWWILMSDIDEYLVDGAILVRLRSNKWKPTHARPHDGCPQIEIVEDKQRKSAERNWTAASQKRRPGLSHKAGGLRDEEV